MRHGIMISMSILQRFFCRSTPRTGTLKMEVPGTIQARATPLASQPAHPASFVLSHLSLHACAALREPLGEALLDRFRL